MKKCITKIFAAVLSVFMVLVPVSMNVFAADTMTLSENPGMNTDYYSNVVYHGENYVASLFQGVSKDKVIAVKKGETVKLTYGAADHSDTVYANVDWSSLSQGYWNYGNGTDFCVATDSKFTFSGDGVTATVGGFGSESNQNGKYGQGHAGGTALQTTFTIDTSNLEAKTYNMTLHFKYQFKQYKSSWFSKSWNTMKEYGGDISGFKLIVLDEKMDAMGGSIRVANSSNKNISGLRFGFQTTESEDNIKEYGFLYSYDERNAATLTDNATGVIKTTASNYINHGDYTTFNLVFTGITSQYYDMKVSARSYVVTNDDVVHYSDVKVRSFKGVANNILSDPDVEQDTKDAIQKMLDSGSIDA